MSRLMASQLLREINRTHVFNTQSTLHMLKGYLRCILKESHFFTKYIWYKK